MAEGEGVSGLTFGVLVSVIIESKIVWSGAYEALFGHVQFAEAFG